MNIEIERKFLVNDLSWKINAKGEFYRQGYLCSDNIRTVRVRIAGNTAWMTVKSKTKGISRDEFEYEIPVRDAERMLDTLCSGPIVEKIRYKVMYEGKNWDIDEFLGDNEGLIIAEVELNSEKEKIEIPFWAGEEVSGNPKYYNSYLSEFPYNKWELTEKVG